MPRLARSGYDGPTLLELLNEANTSVVAQRNGWRISDAVRDLSDLTVRAARELQARAEAARAYARREGSMEQVRVQLERDELRALIADFTAGVIP